MGAYDSLAAQIVDKVGGSSNIVNISHCMTRLRLKLKDDSIADTKGIEQLDKVIRVVNANGQYQVVVGMNVIEDLYDAVAALTGAESLGEVTEDGEPVKHQNAVSALIDLISGIIAPILAVLCAAGMIKGILTIAVFLGRQMASTRCSMQQETASSTSCRSSWAIPRPRSSTAPSSSA